MLDSAAFYTLSGNSLHIFLIHIGHSSHIPSTFEVHSEHYNGILDIPTVLRIHSSCVRELIQLECARIIRCGFAANSYYSNSILKKSFT